MVRTELHEENRLSWNVATQAHNSHKRDQAKFLREGGKTLFPEEMELLGDVTNRTLVHLQCNAGQDTLSLASLGALATGVDISDVAIDFARGLSEASGIRAVFHRADVYDWLAIAGQSSDRFDIAFTSYGAVTWLSDLNRWALGISRILAPGGRFVMVEFHPLIMIFEDDWTLKYPYFGEGKVLTFEEGIGDYVADAGPSLTPSGYQEGVTGFRNPYRCHEFQWSLSEVIMAFGRANMELVELREYPYMNGAKLFKGMRETPVGRMLPPQGMPSLPLMFGLVARKRF